MLIVFPSFLVHSTLRSGGKTYFLMFTNLFLQRTLVNIWSCFRVTETGQHYATENLHYRGDRIGKTNLPVPEKRWNIFVQLIIVLTKSYKVCIANSYRLTYCIILIFCNSVYTIGLCWTSILLRLNNFFLLLSFYNINIIICWRLYLFLPRI